MKKFLTGLFAAMLFVPVLSGCGQSNEAETLPDDPETSNTGGMAEDDYAAKMKEAEEQARDDNQ